MSAESEQLYSLIKQWCNATNREVAHQALQQIARITGCLRCIPEQWADNHSQAVLQWLQDHYLNAYLLAVGKTWVGHPAMVWGIQTKPAPSRLYSDLLMSWRA